MHQQSTNTCTEANMVSIGVCLIYEHKLLNCISFLLGHEWGKTRKKKKILTESVSITTHISKPASLINNNKNKGQSKMQQHVKHNNGTLLQCNHTVLGALQ